MVNLQRKTDSGTAGAILRDRAPELLFSGLWGFEREALRVDGNGQLAATDHPFPPELDRITVDFAENQIELITKPKPGIEAALAELESLHREAYAGLKGELLWPLSVPGRWDEPGLLRPASFGGREDRERARHYRAHLLERYGSARQAISGLHYNFSLSAEFWSCLRQAEGSREEPSDFANRRYLDLARNMIRYLSLPTFLFSASPVIDPLFARELALSASPSARAVGRACAGRQASLRLGSLGYRLPPETARKIDLRFRSLSEYIEKIEDAIQPSGGGLLDSEGEFYAPLRLKAAFPGEKASLAALRARGVEYIELRFLDLDPFAAPGIGIDAARFIHLLALACLLLPSPALRSAVTEDDRLSTLASSCSHDSAGLPREARMRRLIARQAAPVIGKMEELAAVLPSGYGEAVENAKAMLSGSKLRSIDRFARLTTEKGSGLAAGIALAREHERIFLNGGSTPKTGGIDE
jgi:glutamate--cysteine ligase